ncbi:hypothetical protein ABT264_36205 [Streptomyces virginiae]|uniref:hypothetical protein n=1 Tax=Streptomyces virginiae TaxID=1961 RepID=UPI00331B07B1
MAINSSQVTQQQGDALIESWLDCTVCNNGLLVFMTRTDTGRLYLECDECLSGYTAISTSGVDCHFWTDQADWDGRPASRSDVLTAGFDWSIRNES